MIGFSGNVLEGYENKEEFHVALINFKIFRLGRYHPGY